MKFINKILLIAVVLAIGACEATDFELQDDPNAITPERASVNDLYNSIQLNFAGAFESSQGQPGAMARMYHAGAFNYQSVVDPTNFNGLWFNLYSNLIPDIDALLPLADAAGLTIHSGSAKIMKAYALMIAVDCLGDIPLNDAGKGTEVISPAPQSGADVYAQAIALLDEAIGELTGTTAPSPTVETFYGGNADKWITLAKTLKFRAGVTTRLVGGSVSGLLSDLIDEEEEDFQINYGSTRENPDSRHWMYRSHYEAGDGAYMSNSYMWRLRAEKLNAAGNPVIDPRIRYYFYRKVEDSVNQDLTTYSCHFSEAPDQEAKPTYWDQVDSRIPYCYASQDGYIGRDHLNGSGIPPDGPIRTSYGLYPGGGQFDDNSFTPTQGTGKKGGLGAGITPMLTASFIDFLRAEAALTMGTGEDAKALLESGIRKSMAKVFGFENLVSADMARIETDRDGNSVSIQELYGSTEEDVDEYVALVLDIYDNSSDKLDVVMREYFIALWGNGLEAYNMYRRTGKPNNIAPGLEADPGPFPRSFFYPAVHVNRNSAATQKAELSGSRVFWDDGSVDLY